MKAGVVARCALLVIITHGQSNTGRNGARRWVPHHALERGWQEWFRPSDSDSKLNVAFELHQTILRWNSYDRHGTHRDMRDMRDRVNILSQLQGEWKFSNTDIQPAFSLPIPVAIDNFTLPLNDSRFGVRARAYAVALVLTIGSH